MLADASTLLYCPACGHAIEASLGSRPNAQIDDPSTPLIRRRTYACPDCGAKYHASEWLDVHTDRLVYHLSQLARFFAHPLVASNLGTNAVDDRTQSRGQVVMRVHSDQGKVREYRGKKAPLLWQIFSERKSVELQADRPTRFVADIKFLIETYDLPLRVLHEDGKAYIMPEGAWHHGQVYGDENDARFTRITFGLSGSKKWRSASQKD
jgi:transcriptional regulator NrdR family protein